MKKEAFLEKLREKLSCFPLEDMEERILFYEEMIEERIEEGMAEEDAVAAVGSLDDIVAQVMTEVPLSKLVMKKVKPKRKIQGWEIVLLILGFPLWFPLLISAVAILFSFYVVLWSIAISMYAITISLAIGAALSIPGAWFYHASGNPPAGMFLIGAGLILVAFTIWVYCLSALITKGIIWITKKMFLGIKELFVRKEGLDHANA